MSELETTAGQAIPGNLFESEHQSSAGEPQNTPTVLHASVCPSTTHADPVPGTVAGLFSNPYRQDATSEPVVYCEPCATTGDELGFFTPTGVIE